MADFTRWQAFMMQRTGIYLQESKRYLIENRLAPLVRDHAFEDLQNLFAALEAEPGGRLEHEVVELMTTHETSFFRDPGGFKLLQHAFLNWHKLRQRHDRSQFRVWSAGCSTGEEVWSMIMTLMPLMRSVPGHPLDIWGTDIAPHTIQAAKAAIFWDLRNKVSPDQLERYFEQVKGRWQIKPDLHKYARFEERNLFELPKRMLPFDVIFCRNVAIYFQVQYRAKLFADLSRFLKPGGYLVLGGSESLFGVQHTFKRVQVEGHYFYQKHQ
jgi:chemotaxis protein methyltransferase CheR